MLNHFPHAKSLPTLPNSACLYTRHPHLHTRVAHKIHNHYGMSRKPLSSATGPRSNASVTTMPAPSRTMARSGKPTTIVRESVKVAATESRPTSPNGGSRNRRTVSAEKKVASKASTAVERTVDGEEMNIQVVVRCR